MALTNGCPLYRIKPPRTTKIDPSEMEGRDVDII